jgi:hypothetical protein
MKTGPAAKPRFLGQPPLLDSSLFLLQPFFQTANRWICNFVLVLEEEPESNLNLPAGISEVAVGVRRFTEAGIKRHGWRCCRATENIARRIRAGHVLMIEEVKRFAQNFKRLGFGEPNLLREAQIHVHRPLQAE